MQLRVLKLNIANVIAEKERKKQRSSDEAIFLCFVIQWGAPFSVSLLNERQLGTGNLWLISVN